MVKALTALETPALLLDRRKLETNARRMIDRAHGLGARMRPHLKTLKSIDAARIARDPAHGGIAAATLNEAEYFADHGIEDIQYAVCIVPHKLPRAARILAKAARFSMFVDSREVAVAVTDFARQHDVPLRTWIEIDSGEHRTGVDPDGPDLLAIARALAGPVVLEGVATHAGQSYAARSVEEMTAIAESERRAVVHAAERLRGAGFPVEGVSAGSTPTATFMRSSEGLTELRAGVYLAGDLFQAGLGTVSRDDIAVSVLATVISHQRARRQIVVDAGSLALSNDRSTARIPGRDCGYGLVVNIDGNPSFGELLVDGVHQEHGEIRGVEDALFDALPIGSKVRILPNHACMTTARYDRYTVVEGGRTVVDEWPRTNGWD
jgi:D-serine deaminase-like pyridoxal phosphate-dependent protein